MFNSDAMTFQQMAPSGNLGMSQQMNVTNSGPAPYINIIEQPASKSLRFRYECEGRSAGSIPGVHSTPENKTYPEIQIMNYKGPAIVVVSCVTADDYKAHPHSLVGRDGCRKGVCTVNVPQDTMRVQFSNLGIQCVKRKEIDQALLNRKSIRVDPFRKGFSHMGSNSTIDLNKVRLCFQAFIANPEHGNKCNKPLQPVVSDVIYDKKAISELTITKLSHCVSFVEGGRTDMIILCEKVAKENIQVRFFEKDDRDVPVWQHIVEITPMQVHKQVAIWFKTPPYKNLDVKKPVKCFIELVRPSDGATSEPVDFELLPRDTVVFGENSKRKRSKVDDEFLMHMHEQERLQQSPLMNTMDPPIKTEPRESTSPYNYAGSPATYQTTHSPYNAMVESPYQMTPSVSNTTQYIPPFDQIAYNLNTIQGTSTQNPISWNIPPNIQPLNTMTGTPTAQIPAYENNLPSLPQTNYMVHNMDTGINSSEIPAELPDSLSNLNLQDFSEIDSLTKLTNQRAEEMLN